MWRKTWVLLKGAMTNQVYQINWPTKNGGLFRKLLVRLYGEGVQIFFNRDDEIRTFERMSSLGQGLRLLGLFPHGRVEEFIHKRTLSAPDLCDPEISALIAAKMGESHMLDMPGLRCRKVYQLVEDAEKYTLANHLFWGLWGIISAYVNKIDFDYMEYARQRFDQYWLKKPTLVGSSDSLISNHWNGDVHHVE